MNRVYRVTNDTLWLQMEELTRQNLAVKVCAAGARTTHAASTCSESTAATMASSLISEMSSRVREEEVLAEDAT